VNLARTLLYAAERHPDAEAVVDDGERLTYAALQDRAARLATGLGDLGLRRGDRLAALLKNRAETVALYWACQWLGAWFVPLNHRLGPDEAAYCVEDAGAPVIAFDAAGADAARTLGADGGRRLLAVADAPDGDAAFADLCRSDPAAGALDLDDGEISLMLYTSGTTGRPKGVPRSHRADRAAGLSQVVHHGLGMGDRTLGVMPLYHTMGIHALTGMAAINGCFVCQPEWSAAGALRLIRDERISALYLIPTLFYDLVHAPECSREAVESVTKLGYAGAPMLAALTEACVKTFEPHVFVNHYGSTEIYTFSVRPDVHLKPGSAGRPGLHAALRVVTASTERRVGPDELVPPGEPGEIIASLDGDEAFAGYWQRPDADARALRGGWYFTGDMGYVDADGELYVTGRVDDMIISGGENIHPVEVEEVLARHPQVRDVAVIGEPDDRWGERVVAFVVPMAAGLTAEALDRHCRDSPDLANFKRPRRIVFVGEIPKTASGKILRRLLRDGRDTETRRHE